MQRRIRVFVGLTALAGLLVFLSAAAGSATAAGPAGGANATPASPGSGGDATPAGPGGGGDATPAGPGGGDERHATAGAVQRPDTVFLDELTWVEVREAQEEGTTTIIIPTAGTEQNGPHMVLGKHKFIVTYAAERIARELGNALVAPTVTYVPEGNVERLGAPNRAGTITLPNEFYMKLLEYAARSLMMGGFTDIVMIGDSGGNQRGMRDVATMLNEEWAGEAARVHFVGDYYSKNGINEWLFTQGETEETIGSHAGIRDTSQLMFVAPQHIRDELRAPGGGFEGSGVSGDPSRASVEYGRKGIELKVEASVRQIRALMAER